MLEMNGRDNACLDRLSDDDEMKGSSKLLYSMHLIIRGAGPEQVLVAIEQAPVAAVVAPTRK